MRILSPIVVWLVFLGLAGETLIQNHWEGALVVFAALVLVPTGLALLDRALPWWYWFSAAGVCAGYLFFPNLTAGFGMLPYLFIAVWLTVRELVDVVVFKKIELKNLIRLAALGYWATGAVWALFFLSGVHPLGFDSVIVGLTAAHFHVAGFVLAVVVYCLLSDTPSRFNSMLGYGALVGMPLVATGITSTRIGYSPVFEWVSALGFVAFALGVVWQHLTFVFQNRYSRKARLLWLCGALCLLAGGTLAGLYALRFSQPIQWVNIPNMKVWHGTLNTLGFGWLVLIGWSVVFQNDPSKKPTPGRVQHPGARKT